MIDFNKIVLTAFDNCIFNSTFLSSNSDISEDILDKISINLFYQENDKKPLFIHIPNDSILEKSKYYQYHSENKKYIRYIKLNKKSLGKDFYFSNKNCKIYKYLKAGRIVLKLPETKIYIDEANICLKFNFYVYSHIEQVDKHYCEIFVDHILVTKNISSYASNVEKIPHYVS